MKNGTEQGGQLKKITPYNENLWLPVWPSILFVILPDKRVQQWSSHPGLCWHICCSAQNLPPTRYNTQPSHPTVYTRHPLCIPFGSDYGVSYTYAPSSIIQLLFHKSRTIQRGANQDEYDFFLFSCFLRQVESSIFSKIYSAEACSADVWYG